jgi:hypothetical protein
MTPFKNRMIDPEVPVKVYRNLGHAPGDFSIMQKGLVVAHADEVVLQDVTFRVSNAGRNRVLDEKRKNVHAFAVGTLSESKEVRDRTMEYGVEVTYNPYNANHFYVLRAPSLAVSGAHSVFLGKGGVRALYPQTQAAWTDPVVMIIDDDEY